MKPFLAWRFDRISAGDVRFWSNADIASPSRSSRHHDRRREHHGTPSPRQAARTGSDAWWRWPSPPAHQDHHRCGAGVTRGDRRTGCRADHADLDHRAAVTTRASGNWCWLQPFRLRHPRNLSRHVIGAALWLDLDVPDPSLSQGLFLNSISRCGGSLIVAVSMVLNGRNRIATAGDYEEVNALAVDRAVGPRIGAGENLTQAYLRHNTPVEVRRSVDCPFGGVQDLSL